MQKIEQMLSTLTSVANISDQIEYALSRITFLEQEVRRLKKLEEDCWMPLKQAAEALEKTPDAIRQRIFHKESPMPEGVVWEQRQKGCSIKIHLSNYRKYM